MSSGRSRLAAGVLACLLASFATAALAHMLIGALGALAPAGDDAYASHQHGSLGPVMLAAAALLVVLLLRAVGSALGRREHRDPFVALARAVPRCDPGIAFLTIASAGAMTLGGMEFVEQLSAFGRITGIGDALGGNAALGGLALLACALLTTLAGERLLRYLVVATVAASALVAAWVRSDARDVVTARWARRRGRTSRAVAQRVITRTHGLRAPPFWTRLAAVFALF